MLTRDETLGEPFEGVELSDGGDHDRPVWPLRLRLRFQDDGAWTATLAVDGVWQMEPLWEGKGEIGNSPAQSYQQLTSDVSAASGPLVDGLRRSGASNVSREPNPDSSPPADVLERLSEMNFVSQYAAARSAHSAIRQNGASSAWYGVLVRAYANLSALTHHTWSSQTDAFAARSLIYAERMVQLDDRDDTPRWHRAYAYAVLGMHSLAESEIEGLSASSQQGGAAPPNWAELIRAVAAYDHAAIDACAGRHAELAETAAYLQWELYYSYLHRRWIHQKGLAAMRACPEAYGVYSAWANWDALRIKRRGSATGIAAFGGLLPQRVSTLRDLPRSVQALTLDGSARTRGSRAGRAPPISPLPMQISRALASTPAAADAELSWPVLGALIAEEQFVQIADLLFVAGDAVERSHAPTVDAVRPLVKTHRYAPFIESYSFPQSDRGAIRDALEGIEIVDARGVMENMLVSTWDIRSSGRVCGSDLGIRSAVYSPMRLPSMLETYNRLLVRWENVFTDEQRTEFSRKFPLISEHSPLAKRQSLNGETTDAKDIKKAEKDIGADPIGWRTAAAAYERAGDDDNAIRCYEESLRLGPSYEVTEALASLHLRSGSEDKWRATLESHLDVEDLGLFHSKIHQQLALEYLKQRRWKDAEPHAIAAAGTGSASGLALAAQTYEGMQDFEASEKYFATASRYYPSNAVGMQWYFFQRRTGFGELEAARAIAEKSIVVAEYWRNYDASLRIAMYRWLEGDLPAAIEVVERRLPHHRESAETWTSVYNHLFSACLAVEADDEAALDRAIRGVRSKLDSDDIKAHNPGWVEVLSGICDAFDGEGLTKDFVAILDEALAEANVGYRCDYSYFAAVAMERAEEQELADEYYRRAAFQAPFNRYTGTLAGRRLIARHGLGRGGQPAPFPELEEAAEADSPESADDRDASEPTADLPASSK